MNWYAVIMNMVDRMYQLMMIQVVVVEDQWQVNHIKNQFYHLVGQSTFWQLDSMLWSQLWEHNHYKQKKDEWVIQNSLKTTSLKKPDDYKKISGKYQGGMWEMVYRQDEFQYHPYQEKSIEQKGANQRIQNQGNNLEGQWSLEWLEVPITQEQAWIGRPEETRP